MFGRKKAVAPTPRVANPEKLIDFPDGVFVVTESDLYFLKGGRKFRCFSYRTFKTWNAEAFQATERNISHYKKAGVLGFRDGTLIKDLSDGRIYMIAGAKRRHVTNPDWLNIFKTEPVVASHDEVLLHGEGEELNGLDRTKAPV